MRSGMAGVCARVARVPLIIFGCVVLVNMFIYIMLRCFYEYCLSLATRFLRMYSLCVGF